VRETGAVVKLRSPAVRWLVKIGIAFVAFYLLARSTDLAQLRALLRVLPVGSLFISLGILTLSVTLTARAWQTLLAAQGIGLRLYEVGRLYMVGLFFAAFTPAGAGGDAVRIRGVYRYTLRAGDSVASNVILRILSFSALLIVGSAGYLANRDLPGTRLSLLVLLAVAAGLLGISRIERTTRRFARLLPTARLTDWAEQALTSFYLFRAHPGALAGSGGLLLLAQMVAAISAYPLARGLGLDIPLEWFLAVIPLARLASYIPITPSGAGVYEGVAVLLFSHLGVAPHAAFALALLDDAVLLTASLMGGIFCLADRGPRSKVTTATEEALG